MTKSRSFSIFLIKEGIHQSEALKDDHNLEKIETASNIPDGAELFLASGNPSPPWWKEYFGIQRDLYQEFNSAILFLAVEERSFAITFGHSRHNLDENSYEHDFGLITTLNSVNPEALKSADTLQPANALRTRAQLPEASELYEFNFDQESSILKKLTGAVKEEFTEYFRQVTGSESIRITSKKTSSELLDLCNTLLDLYSSNEYRKTFKNLRNIESVKEPSLKRRLDNKLLESLKSKDSSLFLAIPYIEDYSNARYYKFSPGIDAESDPLEDVTIEAFYHHLENSGKNIVELNLDDLKSKYKITTIDENGYRVNNFSLYRHLLYSTSEESDSQEHHLNAGEWYSVEKDYGEKILKNINRRYYKSRYLDYNHENEAEYNLHLAKSQEGHICLDKKSISPVGETSVEPCDVLGCDGKKLILIHVKRSTRSQGLSHLFNQGMNSHYLLSLYQESRESLFNLISKEGMVCNDFPSADSLNDANYEIIYCITTSKDVNMGGLGLPLFSRISLHRALKEFDLRKVSAKWCYIKEISKE